MPIVRELVKQSLKHLDTCPKCKVSWRELEDSLHEGLYSGNCYIALLLIRNCDICMARFAKEYNIMKGGK